MSRNTKFLLFMIAAAVLGGACKRAPTASSTVGTTPAVRNDSNKGIETELVTTAPIAGGVVATGKVLVPEDRMAVIGPVNEGRIVKLYAGQGSRVRKGQKLAELESADIDQAEADY